LQKLRVILTSLYRVCERVGKDVKLEANECL
jgi:hypothetical protein